MFAPDASRQRILPPEGTNATPVFVEQRAHTGRLPSANTPGVDDYLPSMVRIFERTPLWSACPHFVMTYLIVPGTVVEKSTPSVSRHIWPSTSS